MGAARVGVLGCLAGLSAWSPPAEAMEVDLGGRVQTDIRYAPDRFSVGEWYAPYDLEAGFSRNQNLLKLRGSARGDRARAVFDVDLVYIGIPGRGPAHGIGANELTGFSDLTRRSLVDPFRIEAHSLYMEAWDLFGVKALDLRVGQQLVQWGVGDQFNPTNNLNADDVEDPLLFGDQQGNVMARLDYSPVIGWSLSGVFVPVFKPALLPGTALLGLADSQRVPVLEDELRWTLLAEQAQARELLAYPTVVDDVVPQLPDPTLANAQWSVRLAGTVGMQDLAVSWYDGRSDFPVAVGNHTSMDSGERCNPDDAEDCINGLLLTEAAVTFPEMQVLGFNAAGEVNPLGWISEGIHPIGYRLEVAWIHPERTTITLTNDELDFGLYTQPEGEYDYGLEGGGRPTSVRPASFLKWTAGLDYTFGRHVYVNAQWVHGFPDEFGAGDWLVDGPWELRQATVTDDLALLGRCAPLVEGMEAQPEACVREVMRPRLGDYGVLGVDLTFGDTLLRLFTILDFTPVVISSWDEDAEKRLRRRLAWSDERTRSMVLYPELSHNFGNGFELAGGAVVMMGGRFTKFGDPATGGTQLFTRAAYSF